MIQAASAKVEAEIIVITAMQGGRNTVNATFLEMVAGSEVHKSSKYSRPTAMSGQRKTNKPTWLGWQKRGGASSYESTVTKWLVDEEVSSFKFRVSSEERGHSGGKRGPVRLAALAQGRLFDSGGKAASAQDDKAGKSRSPASPKRSREG